MRKTMKRNIQRQRQQRSVTYMRTEQDRRERKQRNGNIIGGILMGLFFVVLFYGAIVANEKRMEAIGVSSSVEQSK